MTPRKHVLAKCLWLLGGIGGAERQSSTGESMAKRVCSRTKVSDISSKVHAAGYRERKGVQGKEATGFVPLAFNPEGQHPHVLFLSDCCGPARVSCPLFFSVTQATSIRSHFVVLRSISSSNILPRTYRSQHRRPAVVLYFSCS